jgi:glycosyltransferase involved in cell wall biosynthesis
MRKTSITHAGPRARRLAIVELFHHHEVTLHYARLLADAEVEVAFYLHEDVYEALPPLPYANFTWRVMKNGSGPRRFLRDHQADLQTRDATLFATVAGHFRLLSARWGDGRRVLLVHNARSFLEGPQALRRGEGARERWRQGLRIVKRLLLEQESRWRRRLIDSMDMLLFPAPAPAEYATARLAGGKAIAAPPLAFYQGEKTGEVSEPPVVVIPGTIDPAERDYGLVMAALPWVAATLNTPLNLVLLGRPRGEAGQAAAAAFRRLANPQLRVLSFEDSLPQTEYEAWLAKAKLLLMPPRESVPHAIYWEYMGRSKITGAINDMIRFGIPALLPDFYPLSGELENWVGRYEDANHLAQLLRQWLREDIPARIRQRHLPALRATYSLERVRDATLHAIFGE